MSERDELGPAANDARPALGFRVGVTGHRKLDVAAIAAIESAVSGVLADIDRILTGISRDPQAGILYRDGAPIMRIVSPLAEGADRLVARLALARGWRLAAPLPFAREDYERDFPDSVPEFRSLLAHARDAAQIVELDGSRAKETAAYLQVGRFVLDHSDLLIAVWDGAPAAGEGGTGQIVAEALAAGVPTVHVDAKPPHSAAVLDDADNSIAYDGGVLAVTIRRLLLPEWRFGRRDHGRAAIDYLRRERVRGTDVAPDFLYRGPFTADSSWLRRLFPLFMRRVGGTVTSAETVAEASPPAGADNPAVRTLYLHYQRADTLATLYAETHRSGYILIYLFGAASLVAAFTSQYYQSHAPYSLMRWTATVAELLAIVLIVAMVRAEGRFRWRERWLDYRLLAESLREADLLAQLGGAPLAGSYNRTNELHPERGWIPWLVGAIGRSVGVVGARYDADYLTRVRDYAATTRLPDQIAYHERTERRNAKVSSRLKFTSQLIFLVSVFPVIGEFIVPTFSLFGLASGLLPAVAAASFGIRNQAEFEIIVHRSARLRERLADQRDRLRRLTGTALTSAALARAIRRSARTMQRDTAEWADIFEVKESDVS